MENKPAKYIKKIVDQRLVINKDKKRWKITIGQTSLSLSQKGELPIVQYMQQKKNQSSIETVGSEISLNKQFFANKESFQDSFAAKNIESNNYLNAAHHQKNNSDSIISYQQISKDKSQKTKLVDYSFLENKRTIIAFTIFFLFIAKIPLLYRIIESRESLQF